MIRIYLESGQIRIEPYLHLFDLDTLIAEEINRDGLLRVNVRHASFGVHDDMNGEYQNNLQFCTWDQFTNDMGSQHGIDHNDTITNLNTLFSS